MSKSLRGGRGLWIGLSIGAGLWLTAGTAQAQRLFANPACAETGTCDRPRLLEHHRQKRTTYCTPKVCPESCFGYFRTRWTPWEVLCAPGAAGCVGPAVPPVMVTHPAPPPAQLLAPSPAPAPAPAPLPPAKSGALKTSEPKSLPIPSVPKVSVQPPPAPTPITPEVKPVLVTQPAPKTGPLPPASLSDLGAVLPPVPVVPTSTPHAGN